MKKTDVAMLILIASVSVIIAFVVARSIFGDVYTGSAKVKTIDLVEATVQKPSAEIFNKDAINPAVQVYIEGTK